ncbi:YihY/virulence factor BrkB family protein [Amycolatopsis sp. SID8362]|uniref:YihY/virulence factor BrkB family protein n=1 Tax=Amycolatopsis sp. SID8362 TaxID=2690346 RepID=UPI0013716255|nr:YihY/virulence factor BrkB family protein [Amycolatopsis sp. SID8362]NBH07106.1 YihY/virulence factor BrkB family protein [Amycolatopsis sp. SID8362]NED43803.1 YihY/virulence factor BrkB family protein [Amycolatopsis sp. SID8362]
MGEVQPSGATKVARKGPWRLLTRTLGKAWEGNIFSEAAEAAFWQTLSLPPLLLGLLGSLGFVGEWFGTGVVSAVHDRIIGFCRTVFSSNAVQDIIEPTVNSILTVGKGEIVSVGFLISLWAGSSAMSSFVDAITVAHDQYGVRNDVWQRIFALLLYLCGLVILVVGLPLLAIGPDLLPEFFPADWRPTVTSWVSALYFPALGAMITLALTTLYKLALPRKLPWHRGLPGAVLAMVVFLLSSVGLRVYLNWITKTGYTYGALAAPIAFLLLMFFIGLAVVGGAYFNSALQELWPAKATRRQRRKWRRLEMERASERLRTEEGRKLWERTTTPLKRPRAGDAATNGSEPSEEDTPSPSAPDPAPSAPQGRVSSQGTTRNPPSD